VPAALAHRATQRQEAAKGTHKQIDLSRMLGMNVPPVEVELPPGLNTGQTIQVRARVAVCLCVGVCVCVCVCVIGGGGGGRAFGGKRCPLNVAS
jgi:hypothetical protein